MYFLQRHISGYLGNAPMWWAQGDRGYTAYLENAKQFTKEEAEHIAGVPVGEKGEKYTAYPVDFIMSRSHQVFDMQDFHHLEQWKG